MDVIHLERPFADPDLNTSLWASADEEPLAVAMREKLAAHGFRVAVLGGSLPPILKTLFDEEEIGQMNGEHLQLQHAVPTLVQTGGADSLWPREIVQPATQQPAEQSNAESDKANNGISAVGTLRVTPRITPDGCIDLSVIPEIQYGDARKDFVPSFGTNGPLDWSIQVGRKSRLLEDLGFSLRLRSGQYAIVGCFPGDRDSLASRFFTRLKAGQTMQRIVLIQVEPSHEALAARSVRP
jgi:hypothetical protein